MATPKETANKLVEAIFETYENDNVYRAQVAGEIIDALVGTDPRALVRSIKGVPAEMIELISDGIKDALIAQVLKRLEPAAE